MPTASGGGSGGAVWTLLFLLLLTAGAQQDDDAWSEGGDDGIIVTEANLAALQAFKAALDDPGGALRSWDENRGAGACSGSWLGIKCARGQVIVIQLPSKNLGGTISPRVGELTALRKLNLHSNRIAGEIPSSLGSLPSLRGLYLFDNDLQGAIPSSLGSSPLLQAVDLSGNRLIGGLPALLASSSRLLLLNVARNNFTGSIPSAWCTSQSLTSLVVAKNDLSGAIPEAWTAPLLRRLDLSGNRLAGHIPAGVANLSQVSTVDLSNNALNGSIPSAIAALHNLTVLNLSRNELEGNIPAELGGAAGRLVALDLSRNRLSGRVPPELAKKFNASSFEGNADLCGYGGAAVQCAATPAAPPPRRAAPAAIGGRRNRLSKVSLICIVVGGALALGAAVCMLMLVAWRFREQRAAGRRERSSKGKADPGAAGGGGDAAVGGSGGSGGSSNGGGKLVHFDGPFTFTADDLLCATAEVMGKSTYGTVYKATLENGNTVVVKRLREGIVRSQREFEAEVGGLGRIRHPNLVALRAYYWGPKDEKLLVYDFMNGGSLAAYLHARGPETPLGWATRMRIALGAARGLCYLHDTEKMVHGNLTSSNILLDAQLESALSDYGLARLMTSSASSTVLATAGSQGYRAPEVSKLKKGSTKSDVYSFGIVLLELLTGKAPGDAVSTGDGGALDLPEWVSSVVKEEWTSEVFDVELLKGAAPSSEDDMLNTLQLAMNCVSPAPSLRPDMGEVLRHLELVAAVDHKSPLPLPPPPPETASSSSSAAPA